MADPLKFEAALLEVFVEMPKSKGIEVVIDAEKCVGYGICLSLPGMFTHPSRSFVPIPTEKFFDECKLERIKEAVMLCPVNAISYELL